MNLREIITNLEPDHAIRYEPDDANDVIALKQFRDDDPIDPWLRELSEQLVGLKNAVQVRMVLSLYLDEYHWGGTEM